MSVRKINGNYNCIGENLKRIRKEKKLSQEGLIRKLNLIGIDMYKNDIWRIEANQRFVKDYEVWGFINVLETTYEELYKNVENKINN